MKKVFVLNVLVFLLCIAQAAEPLADRLLSPVAEVREEAAAELKKLPPPVQERFVPTLMVGLSSEDPEIHAQSAALLKELGAQGRPAVPATAAQGAPEPSAFAEREKERDQTRAELQRLKGGQYDRLKAVLKEEKSAQENWKTDRNPNGGPNDQIRDMLVSGLEDPSPFVRSRSARRLSTLEPPALDAVPTLIRMLQDSDTECRGSAAAALGAMGAKEAVPELTKLLQKEPDTNVRTIALDAVRRLQESR